MHIHTPIIQCKANNSFHFVVQIILQLTMMKLFGNTLVRFYHFVKPTLSSIGSVGDLQTIIQKRLVRNIAEVNRQTLKHYSFTNTLHEASKEVEERTVKLTIINPSTYQQQIVQAKINQDLTQLQIDGLSLPFTPPNQQLHHFSEKRGAPNFQQLQEYSTDSNVIHIFNLPDNISAQDIQATLKTNQIKVAFKYCILGLPAYAKVYFESEEQLKSCLEKIPSKQVSFGQRVAFIKTSADADKLKLGYRRLVVQIDQDSKFEHSAIQFSRYGRVLHIDWPIEASLNPNIDQVKEFYKDSSELIKINKIYKDGTVESEYYPTCNFWDPNQDISTDNIIEQAEKLKESYEHRARFAKNVNVHVGKEHQVSFTNKGYCVVTYSTYEECQNFYFTHSSDMKVQLVGQKLDFEWDRQFRKELLRQIDNQYLLGKKAAHSEGVQKNKEFVDPVNEGFYGLRFHKNGPKGKRKRRRMVNINKPLPNEEFHIFKKIFNKLALTELTQRREVKSRHLIKYGKISPFKQWTKYLRGYRELKDKVNKKTFDELAQMELYGRVLPKDQKIERFIVEDSNYKESTESRLVRENNLMLSYRQIKFRNKYYRRIQERNNRLANRAKGYSLDKVKPVEAQEGSTPAAQDGQNIGKKQFSTRKPSAYYRKRTAQQQANFQMRYQQFIRNTIYEYMGVFHDKVIEQSANYKPSIINPQSLTWPDGSSYFNEDEVLHALQFRRDFARAQEEYEDYIYGSEFIKSSGVNLTKVNSNFKDLQSQSLQYLTDVGVVESMKRVSGQNLKEKVNILNAQASEFGEEYKLQEQNGEYRLVKIRKLQPLLPLNRVHHLEAFIAEHGNDVFPEQSAIFEQFYKQMKSDGMIPDQVSDAFGIARGKTINDVLEAGAEFQINKKDLQMAERAKTYSREQVNEDIESQIQLQKYRLKYRKIDSNYFSKDPSEIYVRDREGYYKVSRYRQI